MKTLGLYIHIPFCRSKCAYCDFYSLPESENHTNNATGARTGTAEHVDTTDGRSSAAERMDAVDRRSSAAERMDRYTDALCEHLARFRAQTADRYQTDTVYFGGGTPSIMGPARLLRIWDAVRTHYNIVPDAEITLEANPESVSGWLRELRDAGFNRLSLGMQSAHDGELRGLGRAHTFRQVCEAVEYARRSGFDNLSLDLMYGIPAQTFQSWRETVRTALDFSPQHLSCYGLKIEPGTPFGRRKDLDLPSGDEQADWYLWTVAELARYGLRQYEISNFAVSGFESRHNRKYWTLCEYAGFGPGAHSDFDGVRYACTRDLDGYIQALRTDCPLLAEKDTPLYAQRERITRRERVREWVMLGLRTAEGLSTADYEHRFGKLPDPLPEGLLSFVDECARAGYLRRESGRHCETGRTCRAGQGCETGRTCGAGQSCEGGRIYLTPEGFLLSNQIIGQFLEWMI